MVPKQIDAAAANKQAFPAPHSLRSIQIIMDLFGPPPAKAISGSHFETN
jgi:hypothetical protein